jgi:catechol 2,3-dioxygenase-like lactoylglutathione lyase family enzyme
VVLAVHARFNSRFSKETFVIDHVSLGAHDLNRATDFYAAVLGVLGYQVHRRTEQEVALGPADAWMFFLYPAAADQALVGARAHIALYAKDRNTALAVHAAALARGAESAREVALWPQFGPDYFGGMFRDLDGHSIEVLTRNKE